MACSVSEWSIYEGDWLAAREAFHTGWYMGRDARIRFDVFLMR